MRNNLGSCFGGLLCLVSLSGCTSSDTRTFSRADRASAQLLYPHAALVARRMGDSLAGCTLLPDRRVTDCRSLGVEGGADFEAATLAFLRSPDFRAPSSVPNRRPHEKIVFLQWRFRDFDGFSGRPRSAVAARFPETIHDMLGDEDRHADCFIKPRGQPVDCRLLDATPNDPFAGPAMQWLETARFDLPSYEEAGRRHIVRIVFHNPAHVQAAG